MTDNRFDEMEMNEERLSEVSGGTGESPYKVLVRCITKKQEVTTMASKAQIIKEICPICGKQFTCKIEVRS